MLIMNTKKFLLRVTIVAAYSLVLIGCAITPHNTWEVGETRQGSIGNYNKLISEVNGWRVWESASPYETSCIAVKNAQGHGYSIPHFGGYRVFGLGAAIHGSNLHLSTPSGGVFIGSPYFFGSKWHRKTSVAEVNGKAVISIDMDLLPLIEGKMVPFEITTGPYEYIPDGSIRQRGTLDFTGVTAAHKAVTECAKNIPKRY